MKTDKNLFSVGIVGCGLIGHKRAKALGSGGVLVACADKDFSKAEGLAAKYGAVAYGDWMDLLKIAHLDIVVVSTLHDSLAEITEAFVFAGKNVLVEKPASRSMDELGNMMERIKNYDAKVRVGFNHRYHRALLKAKAIIDSGDLGDLMFIRARYGHGGRKGYDREWRADPKISGGGELLDQGPHLIDLSRWFLGNFSEISGFAHTYYWDMPVDDNGFLLLKTDKNQVAFLHVSCTEWKNLFSMEIYGQRGKIDIAGLGGSYGLEKLTHYTMLPEMGPPETQSWEYPMEDNSWESEMTDFYKDILLNREPSVGLKDAYEALKIIQKTYKDSNYDHCP
jgi:predicted dehydrogenase